MTKDMPKTTTSAQRLAYLRTLARTANASLAAEAAGVSRSWAYKRRAADARFDALCCEMIVRFRESPPLPHPPAAHAAGPSLSFGGRGADRRVRVNRDRAGGWTAAKEARFIERLRETCGVPFAAVEAGLSTVSAYRRRQRSPRFAAAWDEALRAGWPPADQPWLESALCFLEGREPPPGNPVRFTRIAQVIDAMEGKRFIPRGPRSRRQR
jgi:hypothetical protein